ncbi:MAG: hypothetical protein VYD45_03960, partial [Pseudomonadota bacterium]|nr:hypothetical protein [Pseudomonadota bacterium]
FALLGLVLCFGEGDLIHGSNESYRFCDGRIIADFGELFRPSLSCARLNAPLADREGLHAGEGADGYSR